MRSFATITVHVLLAGAAACASATNEGSTGPGVGDDGGASPAVDGGDASKGPDAMPGKDGGAQPEGGEAGAEAGGSGDSGNAVDGGGGGGEAGSDGGGQNGQAPVIGGCQVFPSDNPWNTRIDDVVKFPVHAQSATFIANMNPGKSLHADWGDWSTDHYGIPWQTVPANQPPVPMTFQYASESDPGPYPFPANALVEGGANSGGDMHVLVLQQGTCALYETWSSTYVGPGWSCGSGAKFDLTSNALRPDGWTSADAAGLPVLPGLVKLSEVQAGSIQHALRFTINNSQQGYIHPATHAAGSNDASLPPMGLRVRLKASFDLSMYQGASLVILTAMKQYGMLLADNGSDWFVSGDSDDGWTNLMNDIGNAFSAVTGGDFEAVDTGPISTSGL